MIVIVPLSGGNDSFRERGYPYCKPLTEILGRPMVEYVWNCLRGLNAHKFVFVIRKEDALRAHLNDVLKLMDPCCEVIVAEGKTAGAACTALLAIEHIDLAQELVISNGDQILDCDLYQAVNDFRTRELDGGTLVFDSLHPRWSFVRVDKDGLVLEAAEKRPISRLATAGFYYFKRGGDFVSAAREMIRKDANVNGSYFVCPTFNEMILKHAKIGVCEINRESYFSLATPQNVEEYEQKLMRLQK